MLQWMNQSAPDPSYGAVFYCQLQQPSVQNLLQLICAFDGLRLNSSPDQPVVLLNYPEDCRVSTLENIEDIIKAMKKKN